MTFVIPAGNYATLAYDTSDKDFVITKPNGEKDKAPATQATLKKYKDGTIYKPVAIPNSYERINLKKPNLWQAIVQFFTSQVQGIGQGVDIIAFVLILGGMYRSSPCKWCD